MVPFLLYQNILFSDITPTKPDAETFSAEHKSDEKKTVSELHLCTGGNTSGFSCLKLNLFVITLAFLPRETDKNFVSTGVSAACTSNCTRIDTHSQSCTDEQWQQEKKKGKKN